MKYDEIELGLRSPPAPLPPSIYFGGCAFGAGTEADSYLIPNLALLQTHRTFNTHYVSIVFLCHVMCTFLTAFYVGVYRALADMYGDEFYKVTC